jgi:hypothetical protein
MANLLRFINQVGVFDEVPFGERARFAVPAPLSQRSSERSLMRLIVKVKGRLRYERKARSSRARNSERGVCGGFATKSWIPVALPREDCC